MFKAPANNDDGKIAIIVADCKEASFFYLFFYYLRASHFNPCGGCTWRMCRSTGSNTSNWSGGRSGHLATSVLGASESEEAAATKLEDLRLGKVVVEGGVVPPQ